MSWTCGEQPYPNNPTTRVTTVYWAAYHGEPGHASKTRPTTVVADRSSVVAEVISAAIELRNLKHKDSAFEYA